MVRWFVHEQHVGIERKDAREGDAHFPPVDAALWQETGRVRHAAAGEDSVDFSYVTYRRRDRR